MVHPNLHVTLDNASVLYLEFNVSSRVSRGCVDRTITSLEFYLIAHDPDAPDVSYRGNIRTATLPVSPETTRFLLNLCDTRLPYNTKKEGIVTVTMGLDLNHVKECDSLWGEVWKNEKS